TSRGTPSRPPRRPLQARYRSSPPPAGEGGDRAPGRPRPWRPGRAHAGPRTCRSSACPQYRYEPRGGQCRRERPASVLSFGGVFDLLEVLIGVLVHLLQVGELPGADRIPRFRLPVVRDRARSTRLQHLLGGRQDGVPGAGGEEEDDGQRHDQDYITETTA